MIKKAMGSLVSLNHLNRRKENQLCLLTNDINERLIHGQIVRLIRFDSSIGCHLKQTNGIRSHPHLLQEKKKTHNDNK